MKKNMGQIDRNLRMGAAAVVAILIVTGTITGWLAGILGVVAAVFALTGFVGSCPAYMPFGLSTLRKKPSS